MILQGDFYMKNTHYICILTLLSTLGYAEGINTQVTYEHLNFDHSKKKDEGNRYGLKFSYRSGDDLYQAAYEKTNTDTFQPPLTQNLHVNKYYLKYTHQLENKQGFSLSYATIDDNLMKQTDGGNIYGIGYNNAGFGVTQYLSDYKHFNVYQTDLKYTYKRSFGEIDTSAAVIGKYIHLQDRESNPFSRNAKENYFTPGIKLHMHYYEYHAGIGAFFGKRIFAVMDNGFRVQHHAMEFNKTYMVGAGKHFGKFDAAVKYIYQEATEVPIMNSGVTVQNIRVELKYHF